MTLFQNKTVEILKRSNDVFMLTVFNHKLAQKINQILCHYPEGTKFEKNEEPTFPFHRHQIEYISSRSRVLSKILAQIFGA